MRKMSKKERFGVFVLTLQEQLQETGLFLEEESPALRAFAVVLEASRELQSERAFLGELELEEAASSLEELAWKELEQLWEGEEAKGDL